MKVERFKFNSKHMTWLLPLILSGIMSGVISCFNMVMNRGIISNFLSLWLQA
jgi:ABC-type spermidine/putrescine transport system permease subunit II